MSYTMISGYHNCDDGYIALVNLNLPAIPHKLSLHDEILTQKSEFHISLLCIKRLLPLLSSEITEAKLIDDFKKFQAKHSLNTFNSTHEIRLVEKDIRKALVLMVSVPELDNFFRELSAKYSTVLPLQPTHITLYTLQPEKGIGILSKDELETTSKRLTLEELNHL